MRFLVMVCLGALLFAPTVGGSAMNGSASERALSISMDERILSISTGEDAKPASIDEKAFIINGVDAAELFFLQAYLFDRSQVLNSDANSLELYIPVKEIFFKGCSDETSLVLMVLDGEPIILTNEIPCFYAGNPIKPCEIPPEARGVLFLGKDGEPLLLYFYPDILLGKVLAVDSRLEAIFLSIGGEATGDKRWYDLSHQQWTEALPDLQKGDLVQLHIDRRNNRWQIVSIRVLNY